MKIDSVIILVVIAIAVSLTSFFVPALKPTSPAAFILISIWLNLAYLLIGFAFFKPSLNKFTSKPFVITTAIIVLCSTAFLTDIIFIHPDAQGAIAVFVTPILQASGFVILYPLVQWLSNKVTK